MIGNCQAMFTGLAIKNPRVRVSLPFTTTHGCLLLYKHVGFIKNIGLARVVFTVNTSDNEITWANDVPTF
jgi:putative copper export protein